MKTPPHNIKTASERCHRALQSCCLPVCDEWNRWVELTEKKITRKSKNRIISRIRYGIADRPPATQAILEMNRRESIYNKFHDPLQGCESGRQPASFLWAMQAAGLQLGTSCSPTVPHKTWAQPRFWAIHWQLSLHLRACELQDSAFSTLLSDGVRCYHGIVACGGRLSTKNRPVAVFFIYGLSGDGEVSLRTSRRNFLIPPVSKKLCDRYDYSPPWSPNASSDAPSQFA